ncbi:hypothetical protein M0R89_05320 [Halorussus limi]|uniref:Uncharacterized protein n=1 Tax=Halorussus limi TaxID=2938695 RepID=A0A8U0HX37_9EURY|nr:hypothetical protein [Halorussus limi]UPV75487.1 hypothetical protein M0R89_05320 [Halorussus limi]
MTDGDPPWRLLGIGGLASLCCVGTSAVGGAALASGAVAGGAGANVAQVLVTVLTVGGLGMAWTRFGPDPARERDRPVSDGERE